MPNTFVPPHAKKFPFGEKARLITGPVFPSNVVRRRDRLDIKFEMRVGNIMEVAGEGRFEWRVCYPFVSRSLT